MMHDGCVKLLQSKNLHPRERSASTHGLGGRRCEPLLLNLVKTIHTVLIALTAPGHVPYQNLSAYILMVSLQKPSVHECKLSHFQTAKIVHHIRLTLTSFFLSPCKYTHMAYWWYEQWEPAEAPRNEKNLPIHEKTGFCPPGGGFPYI